MPVNSFRGLGMAPQQPPNPECHETLKWDTCENREGRPAVGSTPVQVVTRCMMFGWRSSKGMALLVS